jgi:hypothetical protein
MKETHARLRQIILVGVGKGTWRLDGETEEQKESVPTVGKWDE